jgi:hypothetical protein
MSFNLGFKLEARLTPYPKMTRNLVDRRRDQNTITFSVIFMFSKSSLLMCSLMKTICSPQFSLEHKNVLSTLKKFCYNYIQ